MSSHQRCEWPLLLPHPLLPRPSSCPTPSPCVGHVKIWDMHSGKCLHTLPPPVDTPPRQSSYHGSGNEETVDEENPNAFMWLHLRPTMGALVGVTDEHNIVVYSLKTLSVVKQVWGGVRVCACVYVCVCVQCSSKPLPLPLPLQFVGYSDEVLDMRFVGEQEQCLAVATNSALVKVFQREDLSCQLLSGHSAVVLCLDCSSDGRMMVTGSKVSWAGQRSTLCATLLSVQCVSCNCRTTP